MDMQTLPPLLSPTGLAGLMLVLAGVGAALAMPRFGRIGRPLVGRIAIALLAFQAFHLLEHLIQLGYWFLHPDAAPFMTPWALLGVDGLAAWFALLPGEATPMAGGMEGLHLIGNLLFLAGIVALDHAQRKPLPGIKLAFVAQGLHVAEHILLTGTLWLFGTPLGVSTLFGAGLDVSWGATLRIWFHFLINLLGTIPAAWALSHWRRSSQGVVLDVSPVIAPEDRWNHADSVAVS